MSSLGGVGPLTALLATAVHTAAYLAVTGLIAWVVYSKADLAILRRHGSISTWSGLPPSWSLAWSLSWSSLSLCFYCFCDI